MLHPRGGAHQRPTPVMPRRRDRARGPQVRRDRADPTFGKGAPRLALTAMPVVKNRAPLSRLVVADDSWRGAALLAARAVSLVLRGAGGGGGSFAAVFRAAC